MTPTLRKWLRIAVLIALTGLFQACKEDSVAPDPQSNDPTLNGLLESIRTVELEKARGNALSSMTPENLLAFDRQLMRSKAGTLRLMQDEASSLGLKELVQSRDNIRNLKLLLEDRDIVGIYIRNLEAATTEFLGRQNRSEDELADPNTERNLYLQNFTLDQGLGEFASFIASKTPRGPKLFETITCGAVCGNLQHASTDVNKDQVVWLLSPNISLQQARDMLLTVNGASRGFLNSGTDRAIRVFIAEDFSGLFADTLQGWTEVTDQFIGMPELAVSDRPNNRFSDFRMSLPVDRYKGKTITLGFRIQGVTNENTTVQFRQIAIRGKGYAVKNRYQLTPPAPLELTPSVEPAPRAPRGNTPRPPVEPTTPETCERVVPKAPRAGGAPLQLLTLPDLPNCLLEADGEGKIFAPTQSCKIRFKSEATAADGDNLKPVGQLLAYKDAKLPAEDSLFKKFDRNGVTAQASGWKSRTGANLTCEPAASAALAAEINDPVTKTFLNDSICANRTSKGNPLDILLGPQVKLPKGWTIKIYYSVSGQTLNASDDAACPQSEKLRRLRTLILPAVYPGLGFGPIPLPDATTGNAFYLAAGETKTFFDVASNFSFDAKVDQYPIGPFTTDGVLKTIETGIMEISSSELATKTNDYENPLRLALAMDVRTPAYEDNGTFWYIHAITFEGGN